MDSTTVAIAPVVVERVEEMNAYAVPAMYEAPHVNGQFNKSQNYPDWGANSYSESRRRPVRGGKPHHSRRTHPQAAWTSPECIVPAQSPQWQPQSPPASFQQEQGGPIAVNLQGLPAALCRQNFLEAMLDQAGLADDIQGCVLGEEQDAGKAVIYLANYNAAAKCVQHFGGRRWANAGPAVTASIAEGQDSPQSVPASPVAVAVAVSPQAVGGRSPTSQRNTPSGGARKQRTPKNGPEQLNLPPSALAFPGAWVMPQPALPFMAGQDNYQQASGYCQETAAGNNSPKSTGSNGSNSPKTTRWADLADDDQEDLSDRLSEGSTGPGSTGAGSTGRTRQETGESFFLGCDVDTDDGF